MITIPSWYYYTLLPLACLGVASLAGVALWLWGQHRRWQHHLRVTDEWRQQHLDPDRRPDDPFR